VLGLLDDHSAAVVGRGHPVCGEDGGGCGGDLLCPFRGALVDIGYDGAVLAVAAEHFCSDAAFGGTVCEPTPFDLRGSGLQCSASLVEVIDELVDLVEVLDAFRRR